MYQINLTGFGDPNVNGSYNQIGIHDGQPFYKKDSEDYILIYKNEFGPYSFIPSYYIAKITEISTIPIIVPKYRTYDLNLATASWETLTELTSGEQDTGHIDFGSSSSESSSSGLEPCNCPGDEGPTVKVTLTFAGGGTKEFLGCDFESGVPKSVCPNYYNCQDASMTHRETWSAIDTENDIFAKLKIDAYYSRGTNTNQRTTVNRAEFNLDNNGNVFRNIYVAFPIYSSFDSILRIGITPISYNLSPSNWSPSRNIIDGQFGQLTTHDGITVKWERERPSEWGC